MKKNCLAFCIITQMLCSQHLFAQQLTIIEQNYGQAKQLAQQEQKLLLVDFYTTWCGPCKLLDKLVFRDTMISSSIAKDFIVLRYNAEKDSVYQLTLKHHIAMYPSAVILNGEQRVVRQQYGTGGPDKDIVINYLAFLEQARQLNKANFFIKGLAPSTQLAYPGFYVNYVNRVDLKNSNVQVNHYWDTLTNLLQEIPFKIFCYFGGGNEKLNNYFLQHKTEFQTLYGETDVKFATYMIINSKSYEALQSVNRPRFDSAMNIVKLYVGGEEAQKYIDIMEPRMLQAEGRWGAAYNYLETMKKRASTENIIRFCETAVNKCDDKPVLEKSAKWMKAIVAKDPDHENLAVYARLLLKTGKKQQALEIMKKAVEAGKKSNQDTKEEEKWIRQYFPGS